MRKFRVSLYMFPSEHVVADYYYWDGGFVTFVKDMGAGEGFNINLLSLPANEVTRIDYIGEGIESAPEVL